MFPRHARDLFSAHLMTCVLQHPVLTIPPGRAADWHQRIGTYENLPPPKHVAHRKSLPQPVWELRLNPDYGTLPGIPLLEALQGVGAVGADMPAYAERLMKLNIYASALPSRLEE